MTVHCREFTFTTAGRSPTYRSRALSACLAHLPRRRRAGTGRTKNEGARAFAAQRHLQFYHLVDGRRSALSKIAVLELQVVYRHGTSTVPMRMVSGLDDAVDWWCQSCAYAERSRSFAHEPAMYVVYLGAQRGCPRVGSVAIGININVFANTPHQTLSANVAIVNPKKVQVVGTTISHKKLFRML